MGIKSEKASERFAMIDRWKASGKSIMAFCKEENLSYYTFLYWRDKLNNKPRRSGFLKINRQAIKIIKANGCEIIFATGNRINFSVPVEASYLKDLLS